VLRTGPGHPHFNMGMDEALLLADEAQPTLRLYRWQPAGLSIGYFQSSSGFSDVSGDHVLVRRLTGGGAILHDDELTFSLALDACRLPSGIPESYNLIHRAVCKALAEVGVTSSFPDSRSNPPTAARPEIPWCFAEPTPQDLLSQSGRKLLGSAQRRVRRPRERVLHHGSLVLRPPAATPFCGSVEESTDPETVSTQLEDALISCVASSLDLRPVAGVPTASEQADARRLAAERYGSDSFTHRR